MKNLWMSIMIGSIVLIIIIIGITIYKNNKKTEIAESKNNSIENISNELSEKVTDECIEEYKEVAAKKEKISPNCLLILKKHYEECNHTINEYVDIPQTLINSTEEDLKKEYPYWQIEKFSSNEITLYRDFNSNCGQHFILRDNNGKIVVYKINEDNSEETYEQTEISTQYLSETDKIKIQNGIKVNGIENLNQILEDFE